MEAIVVIGLAENTSPLFGTSIQYIVQYVYVNV